MSNPRENSVVKPKKKVLIHPAVGIWRDRWPKEKKTSDIARELRKEQWQRS